MGALSHLRVARYDGQVPRDEREASYHAFRAGELDGLVATEKSGLGRGHDCSRARLAIYYSNEFSLRDRRQTEDRTENMVPDSWTDVVDLVAEGTRDLDVIEALRAKRSVAEMIVGDPPSRWL
jgi:superfamily II DNA/RNA helicase